MTRPVLALLTLLAVLLLSAIIRHRRHVANFPAGSAPRFQGNYATAPPPTNRPFKVVSWNIKHGIRVETAIAELREVDVLQDAAILLLQEMDGNGVEQIARALGYNYIYYPAFRHSGRERNQGNAVLARWPMVETARIPLPHTSPVTGERRIAVGALLEVGGKQLSVYSVHAELPILPDSQRREQLGHLAEAIAGAASACVIVGGDFNTPTAAGVALVEETVATAGLEPAAGVRVPTLKLGGLGFTLDHLYSRGMTPRNSGVWAGTQASDHFPIWTVVDPC